MTTEPRQPTPVAPVTGIVLHPSDSVAVVTADVGVSSVVDAGGDLIVALDAIPSGHKIARRIVTAGDSVIKYGEVIGRATRPYARGQHVHVHNVQSARIPGTPDTSH